MSIENSKKSWMLDSKVKFSLYQMFCKAIEFKACLYMGHVMLGLG